MRTIAFYVTACLLTARYGFVVLWRAWRGSRRLEDACRCYPRRWGRAILRWSGVPVDLEGAHHLEAAGPCVVVANHQSWFDVFALVGYLPVDYRFVAKKELERVPVFGPAWQACGHISIDRGDLPSAIKSLERAGEGVQDGGPTVVMFPEGTRSRTGELRRFKKGAFVLAIQLGVPVVPVGIVGTRDVMPKGSWRVRPGPVHVRVGAPIATTELGADDRDALTLLAQGAVASLVGGGELDGGWRSGLPIAAAEDPSFDEPFDEQEERKRVSDR